MYNTPRRLLLAAAVSSLIWKWSNKAADANDSDDAAGYSAGAIINVTEDRHVLLYIGQVINGVNYMFVYAGYQITFVSLCFGPPKKVGST